jgi:putative flippase GtrA
MVLMNKLLFFQLMRFGIVGCAAACVHFSVLVFLVEIGLLKPLSANIIAFFVAFSVSYSGHRYWTFNAKQVQHRVAFTKLLLVQLTNLATNEGLFYIFLTYFNLPYPVALLIVLVTLPIFTFSLSKWWVFR